MIGLDSKSNSVVLYEMKIDVFFVYLKIFAYQDSIPSNKISSTCGHLYVVKMKYRSVIFSLFLKGAVYKIADCYFHSRIVKRRHFVVTQKL